MIQSSKMNYWKVKFSCRGCQIKTDKVFLAETHFLYNSGLYTNFMIIGVIKGIASVAHKLLIRFKCDQSKSLTCKCPPLFLKNTVWMFNFLLLHAIYSSRGNEQEVWRKLLFFPLELYHLVYLEMLTPFHIHWWPWNYILVFLP